MGAWVENRFEDSCNRLLRMVIVREYRTPEVYDALDEEMRAAEWVYRYLQGLGIEGDETIGLVRRYVKDCLAAREMINSLPPNGPATEGEPK